MTASASVPDTVSDRPGTPRRTRYLIAALVLLLCGAVSWWTWDYLTRPNIPEFNLSGADPDVADAVRWNIDTVRRRPRSAEAWGQLGQVLVGNKLLSESVVPLSQAEALDPADPRWPYLQGIALLGQNPEQALPCLKRAVAACEQDPSRFPDGAAAAQLRLAETLAANGHNEEAEAHYKEVPAGPLSPSVNYGLGVLALARGDLAEANRRLTACADSPVTRQKAAAQLAALARRLEDERATEYGKLAGQLPPDAQWPDPFVKECLDLVVGKEGRIQLATTLESQGDLKGALKVLRSVANDYPEAQSLLTLGITTGRHGRFQESEASLRQALELEPRLLRAQYYLSLALFAQGDALQQQGQRSESQAKFAEAAHWAQRATELSPRYGEAHFQRGLSLWCLQQREEALASFREAVATRPDLPDGHLWLGRMLAEDGNKEEALQHIRNAVRYADPNDPRPRQALAKLTEE